MAGDNEDKDPIFGDSDGGASHTSPNEEYIFHFWGMKILRHRIRKIKPELDPLDVVRKLLEDFEHQESIEKSTSVVHLHRIIENTHARRRLEKWSLRVIATYLILVLAIVVFTYADIPQIGLPILNIPPNIMIAILTTTTANIIGLGLIVLRGHFLANEDAKKDR